MKKFVYVFPLSLVIILSIVSISESATYTTIQLTNNNYSVRAPQINSNGHVVWSERVGPGSLDYEIFLYDGSTTTRLTNNSYFDHAPQISSNGYVVWFRRVGPESSDYEIFLYDGSTTTQLTNNNYEDSAPQINSNGHVVWYGRVGSEFSDYEIILYDGSTTTQLTNNNYQDSAPQINCNGHIVWAGSDGSDYEIFLYDGTTTTQITNNTYNDTHPQINNIGHIVWAGSDGSTPDIFLYNGSTTTKLSNDSTYDKYPQINSNGYVVWQGGDGSGWNIFLYDASTITKLTNTSTGDEHPQINNNGHVVWQGGYFYGGELADWDIYLYDGSNITKLTDNSHIDGDPQINGNGHVVWSGQTSRYSGSEIFYAVPSSGVTITIANVAGGAVGLEGIWRIDLYDSDGEPVEQYHSAAPSFEMTLPVGTYSAEVFFLYDDGQGIWEYWGGKTFILDEESVSVAFTRDMPWLGPIDPYKPVLTPGEILSVSCTLKNNLSTSVELALEGQIGAGNVMTSDTITIPSNSSAVATIQFTNLPDSGVLPLRYWVKTIPPGESAFIVTDHGVIDGYLSYESDSIQWSEYVCMDYIDQAGNLWQIGFDINNSNDEWFFKPQYTFKNIKYYKNGLKVNPSDAELQMLLDRVAQYFNSFYPSIIIGDEFDTSYGIWRQGCGFSWACGLALIDFDEYERKTIYKELLWDAITCRNHPYLNTEYRVPTDNAYFASSLSLKISSTIDEIWSRYSSSIGADVKALNRMKKLLYIAEISQTDPALVIELNDASKSLGKSISMLKIANKVGDIGMHTVQNIVLMDFLSVTGYAENRIATIKEAYNFVKNNIKSQVDPVLEQAILEMESEFAVSMNSMGDAIVSSFLQVVFEDLGDPNNYVTQKLIALAAGSKLAKKLVGTVAKNFKISNASVATVVMDGIKGLTTVMELGDDWRRIILSGMLSKVVVLYAANDPAWHAAAYPSNGVMTVEAMAKHQVKDVYDLQSVFAFEYLSRGLGLLDSDWNSVLQDAIDSTLEQATSPPYTYPINYASTAVVFGQQVGIAANNLVYSDSLESSRDMLKSIVDSAEKKNRVVNEWAEMMVDRMVDSDNDGISDTIEMQTCSDAMDADSDDDGIADGVEDFNQNGVFDSGETNPCDPDTDGDGIQDGTEGGLTLDDIGPDTDLSVFVPDADPSTTTNPLLDDTDGDGLLDGEEDSSHNGKVDEGEMDPNKKLAKALPSIPLLLLSD